MDKGLDRACKGFVDARIDNVFKKYNLNQNIEGLVAAIEQMLNRNNGELAEMQNLTITELIQDHVYNDLHLVFQKMYEQGFLDGLKLNKR